MVQKEGECSVINPFNRSEHSGSKTDEGAPSARANHWQRDWQLIACVIAVVFLVLAVEETWQDYGYSSGDGFFTLEEPFFKFLHIYVTGLALVLAFEFVKQERAIWVVLAMLVAILFNPIIPIEIESWAVYYLTAAGGFAFLASRSPSVRIAKSKPVQASLEALGSTAEAKAPTAMAEVSEGTDEAALLNEDSGGGGIAGQRKPDRFEGWPRWLRWLLFIAVWVVGALLLRPVGELGGSITGALGAGGLVFLIGWPLFKLGTALVPPKERLQGNDELVRRLQGIASNAEASEAHREEARRRLAELRIADA